MKLKVGDKLLCKININFLKKNEYYIITNIDDVSDDVYVNNDWYILYPNDWYYYVWDYFYTPQELRKMKLKQLMKCR